MLTKIWTLLTLTLLAFTLTACSSGGGGPVQGNPPKVATFAATPNPATAGEAVTFTWTVSGDLDSCQLDTDDGKVFDLNASTCKTTTTQAYTYATAGTYSASFLAEGATEASREVDVVVQPNNPPPAVTAKTSLPSSTILTPHCPFLPTARPTRTTNFRRPKCPLPTRAAT